MIFQNNLVYYISVHNLCLVSCIVGCHTIPHFFLRITRGDVSGISYFVSHNLLTIINLYHFGNYLFQHFFGNVNLFIYVCIRFRI